MIAAIAVFILTASGYLVIPFINIPTSINNFESKLKQIITPNKDIPNDLNYNNLVFTTAHEMGRLPVLNLEDIETIKQYNDFVDNVNSVIKILNKEKLGYQIPPLQHTQDEYEKISKIISEYMPIISEYNDMILAAKSVNSSNQTSINNFYIKTGIFAFVLVLIDDAVFAKPSYEVVNTIYTSSGLTTMAFKCPTCVSVVLGQAHWIVRNSFVSESANALTFVFTLPNLPNFPKLPQK